MADDFGVESAHFCGLIGKYVLVLFEYSDIILSCLRVHSLAYPHCVYRVTLEAYEWLIEGGDIRSLYFSFWRHSSVIMSVDDPMSTNTLLTLVLATMSSMTRGHYVVYVTSGWTPESHHRAVGRKAIHA